MALLFVVISTSLAVLGLSFVGMYLLNKEVDAADR